jgi:type II secretory pathway component GspD/PulD (secretin)
VGLSVEHFARAEEHRNALVDLGYLERREFVVSNRPVNHVISEHNKLIGADPRWRGYRREFLDVSTRGTNIVVIVARREDMPVSAEVIRKADVQ